MRKATLITTCGCVLAALLLFAVPAFRQAFELSLAPWHWVFHLRPMDDQSGFRDLARRAESRRDAEGVAFCAVRVQDGRESARLAEEAVRLAPNLIWVYAVVAVLHPTLAKVGQWVPKLEQWDPQNALFPLITAERIEILHAAHEGIYLPGLVKDPAWQSAMAAAFLAPKYADYLDRVDALQGKLVPRYSLRNPDQVVLQDGWSMPAFLDSRNYADSLIQSGKDLEAQGDPKGAMEKYWEVAHYGQVIDSSSHAFMGRWTGKNLQSMAYLQLQAITEMEGDRAEAAHFASLAAVFDPRRILLERGPLDLDISAIAQWNALEVNAAGLMMLIFAGCGGIGAAILLLRREGTEPSDLRSKRRAGKFLVTGAVGLLLSSAMLYVTYRPYEEILGRIIKIDGEPRSTEIFNHILKGDKSGPYTVAFDSVFGVNGGGVNILRNFVSYTHGLPLGFSPRAYSPPLDAVFVFWLAVIVLGLIGLLFMAVRRLRSAPRANVPA